MKSFFKKTKGEEEDGKPSLGNNSNLETTEMNLKDNQTNHGDLETKKPLETKANFYLYQKETDSLLKLFPELPDLERVLEVYSCNSFHLGLSEIQSQGSIYITGQYICFINTSGDIKEFIAFRDILDIKKDTSKMNTSIEIITEYSKHLYSFFLMRDKTYSMMILIWKNRGKSDLQYTALASSIKYAKENSILHTNFPQISELETILEHYTCSLGNIQQGRLYITNFYNIYFYSHLLFMEEIKEVIHFSDIQSIEKFSNSILESSVDIIVKDRRYSFRNFLTYRDQCFNLITSLWEKYKNRPKIFGVTLNELLAREKQNSSVPKFVENAVTFLTASALDTEGIFRISGSSRDLQYLQFLFDEGEKVDLFACEDKHLVAGLLKKFFRELPEPLFTFEFYHCFLALFESKQLYDSTELFRKLKDLISLLPYHNRRLSRYMFEFLSKVAFHAANNKMNHKNLATIWGTIFLKTSEEEPYSLKQANDITDLTLILINNYNLLFTTEEKEE